MFSTSQIILRSTIGVEMDYVLVASFVEHYRKLGVIDFRFVVHSLSSSSPKLDLVLATLRDLGIQPIKIWITENWNTGDNSMMHREVIKDCPDHAWVISADIDEFQEYPMALPEFIEKLESGKFDLVKGRLTERIARGFSLPNLDTSKTLFEQFPLQVRFGIGNPGKIMLHRKFVLTTPGHHGFEDAQGLYNVSPQVLKVMHFKWFGDVRRKYTDPRVMAHHSLSWEFSAYDRYIASNFYGWRRQRNRLRYSPIVSRLASLLGQVKSVIRKIVFQRSSLFMFLK